MSSGEEFSALAETYGSFVVAQTMSGVGGILPMLIWRKSVGTCLTSVMALRRDFLYQHVRGCNPTVIVDIGH